MYVKTCTKEGPDIFYVSLTLWSSVSHTTKSRDSEQTSFCARYSEKSLKILKITKNSEQILNITENSEQILKILKIAENSEQILNITENSEHGLKQQVPIL